MELILDRILNSDDVLVGRIDTAETSVQGRRLTGAGGPGRQNDSMALPDQPIDLAKIVTRETEAIEVYVNQRLRSIKQAEHDALAKSGRDNGNTDVDIPSCYPHPDSAILGQPLFRDIQPRHHFDKIGRAH